jgi:hypothetical protein
MANVEKRINQDKTISYRVKIRLRGFPSQTATFERLTDAKKWASATETALREGRYFKTSASKKYKLSDLIDRYIKDILIRKPQSIAAQKAQLLWWKDKIGEYILSDVTPGLIAEQRDKLANAMSARNKITSPATVNRYMASLSHAFSIAVREWEWVEDSPIRKISKLKEPRGRVRFLSDDERNKLLDICINSSYPHLHLIVVLALSSGARKMEILGLKWQDISFERNIITLYQTKNNEIRTISITSMVLELLKEHSKVRHINSDFIFPSKNGLKPIDITRPWEAALRKANIEDFRFHDLRHSAASYLAMSGASLAEIAEVLGHKTLQMVKRYSHMSESHTAGVVERMNNKIFG